MLDRLADIGHALGLSLDAALLDRDAFEEIANAPNLALPALAAPFLAGASELVGEAYVLAERRIGRWRAAASLVMTGLVYVVGVVVWSSAAGLFLSLERLHPATPPPLLGVIAISFAPRFLSVLTIAPYYGEFLNRALDAWMMICVGWGLWVVSDGALPIVLACAALGWLCSLGLRRVAGRLIAPVLRRLNLATPGARPRRDRAP